MTNKEYIWLFFMFCVNSNFMQMIALVNSWDGTHTQTHTDMETHTRTYAYHKHTHTHTHTHT